MKSVSTSDASLNATIDGGGILTCCTMLKCYLLLYPGMCLSDKLEEVQELQLKLNTSEEEKRIIKEQLKLAQVSRHEDT